MFCEDIIDYHQTFEFHCDNFCIRIFQNCYISKGTCKMLNFFIVKIFIVSTYSHRLKKITWVEFLQANRFELRGCLRSILSRSYDMVIRFHFLQRRFSNYANSTTIIYYSFICLSKSMVQT